MYKGLNDDNSYESPSTATACHRILIKVAEAHEEVQGEDGHDFIKSLGELDKLRAKEF